jgi:PAS domain S-box-containing protein
MDNFKEIEQDLRDSEGKYHKVFSASRDACLIFDHETLDILDVNAAATVLYGFSREDFLRMKITGVWAEPEESLATVQQVIDNKIGFLAMRYHKKRDGTVFPVEVTPATFKWGGRTVIFGGIRDISERVKAEEDLRFKTFALDHSGDAAFWMNAQGQFIYVNQAACANLGYTREELLGMRLSDIDPDFPAEVWPQAWEEVRRLTVRTLIARHRTKDGRLFPVEVTANYVNFGGQEYNCTTVRDISERVQAERKLQESESQFRQLAESIQEVFWLCDIDFTRIIYMSPAYEKVWGRPHESLYKDPRGFFEGIHPDDRPRVIRALQTVGGSFDEEYRIIQPSGSVRVIHARGFPVRDASGTLYRMAGFAEDITAYWNEVQQSGRLKRQIELLVNSVPEGIYGMDLHGIITFANPTAAKILGWEQADLIGKSAHDVMHHSYSDGTPYDPKTCPIAATVNQGTSQSGNNEVYWRKDGTNFEVEYVCEVIREEGKIQGAVVIFRDITDRRRLEAVTRQAEKLSAVGQLAAGVAHELNNPLAVILGFAQSLARRLPEGDENTVSLRSIEREALRCRNLVQNLLVFSREHKPGYSREDPATMLENALSLVEAQAKVKRLEVRKELAANVPGIEMNGNQIQQVIINLCSNAMDAMPDGGILTVALSPEKDGIAIRVTDTGSGIPKDIRDKIWEPFFTTKGVGKGTGLGLSLVFEIVQKHQGRIDLESEIGKGTTLTLHLPLSQTKQSQAA